MTNESLAAYAWKAELYRQQGVTNYHKKESEKLEKKLEDQNKRFSKIWNRIELAGKQTGCYAGTSDHPKDCIVCSLISDVLGTDEY